MQLRMNCSKVLKNAEAIYLQVKTVESNLPDHIRAILVPNYSSSAIADRQHLGSVDSSFCAVGKVPPAFDDEFGEVSHLEVDPVELLTADFSEMYKSVNFTSPSLIVPPLEDDSSELTL